MYPDALDDPKVEATMFVRRLNVIMSCFSVYFLLKRYHYKDMWKKNFFNDDFGVTLFYKYKYVTTDEVHRY